MPIYVFYPVRWPTTPSAHRRALHTLNTNLHWSLKGCPPALVTKCWPHTLRSHGSHTISSYRLTIPSLILLAWISSGWPWTTPGRAARLNSDMDKVQPDHPQKTSSSQFSPFSMKDQRLPTGKYSDKISDAILTSSLTLPSDASTALPWNYTQNLTMSHCTPAPLQAHGSNAGPHTHLLWPNIQLSELISLFLKAFPGQDTRPTA